MQCVEGVEMLYVHLGKKRVEGGGRGHEGARMENYTARGKQTYRGRVH